MTHRPVRILEDGTHVYKDYQRYTPVPLEKRKYGINKPSDPGAVFYGRTWYLPIPVIPDEDRQMPETRPDSETLEHWAGCLCDVCQRPGASRLWHLRARYENEKRWGVRP